MASGAASRRKGLAGERECADVFIDAGWTLRGLESSGDWLAFRGTPPHDNGHTSLDGKEVPITYHYRGYRSMHVEVKRQERLRIPEWLAQAEAEAPPGVPPVVVFRQNRGAWYAVLPLENLLGLIA